MQRTLWANRQVNADENKQYGDKDLEENGGSDKVINRDSITAHADKLNKVIETVTDKKQNKKAVSLKKQLKKNEDKIHKYTKQIQTARNRSGYNRTDEDATGMRMKNDETLPAYNIVAGSENQLIVSYSIHQNTNDAVCFKDHVDQLEKHTDTLPKAIIADSIFGTEENYEIIEHKKIENYLKFPSFHNEQKRTYRDNPFIKENFIYDTPTDTYGCPKPNFILKTNYYTNSQANRGCIYTENI